MGNCQGEGFIDGVIAEQRFEERARERGVWGKNGRSKCRGSAAGAGLPCLRVARAEGTGRVVGEGECDGRGAFCGAVPTNVRPLASTPSESRGREGSEQKKDRIQLRF